MRYGYHGHDPSWRKYYWCESCGYKTTYFYYGENDGICPQCGSTKVPHTIVGRYVEVPTKWWQSAQWKFEAK